MVASVMGKGLALAAKLDLAQVGGHSPSSLSLIAAPMLTRTAPSACWSSAGGCPWHPHPEDQLKLLVELAGEAALELKKIEPLADEAAGNDCSDARARSGEAHPARHPPRGGLPAFEGWRGTSAATYRRAGFGVTSTR